MSVPVPGPRHAVRRRWPGLPLRLLAVAMLSAVGVGAVAQPATLAPPVSGAASSAVPAASSVPEGAAVAARVYGAVCATCHDAGTAGAPRLGDRRAWAPLIKEGQAALTGTAYAGIRGMPAKGGAPDLSLADFALATVYMANAGGARWNAPDAALLQRMEGVAARQRARQQRTTPPR